MAQIPNRTKYRKQQKGQRSGCSARGNFVALGDYGMQALERGRITSQQIEACRVAINRSLRRKGQVVIRIFPDKPITKKPAETRMGKGKGSVDHWVAQIRPGRVLFEVANTSFEEAQDACRKAAAKLGIKTRLVGRVETV